jgi:hypothetical protein
MAELPPGHLQRKGAAAEKLVHDLALKTFLTDWCYLNPLLPSGKELSDLLIVFGETAIIWQIKDLKLDRHGHYKKAEVDKNIRQLSGARRQLFELKTKIELENPRRGREPFDATSIKEVFLISVLTGEGEDFFPGIQQLRDQTVHVFDREFIEILMKELDTVKDFVSYLRDKELLVKTVERLIVSGGEKELLATYLLRDRSFGFLMNANMVYIADDAWETLQQKLEYKRKKEADKISYGWDSIIEMIHTSGSRQYETLARELASFNRFERRLLSQQFYDAHLAAHNSGLPIYRRFLRLESKTFCFLFLENHAPRKSRNDMLMQMCFVARGLCTENTKVIGIATEKCFEPECTYDYCFLDMPQWTDENQASMEDIRRKTGVGTGAFSEAEVAEEYPSN